MTALFWRNVLSVGFGSFVGAAVVFLLGIWNSKRQEKKYQKDLLITYFCELNLAFHNLCTFNINIDDAYNIMKKESISFFPPPSSYVKFEFVGDKLSFVQKKDTVFFESIMQLEIEMRVYHELSLLYEETRQVIYLKILQTKFFMTLEMVIKTLENVNRYLERFYEIKLMRDDITTNIGKFDDFFNKFVSQHKQSLDDKEVIEKMQKDMEKIRKEWSFDFCKKHAKNGEKDDIFKL